jgi:hypothetical protein
MSVEYVAGLDVCCRERKQSDTCSNGSKLKITIRKMLILGGKTQYIASFIAVFVSTYNWILCDSKYFLLSLCLFTDFAAVLHYYVPFRIVVARKQKKSKFFVIGYCFTFESQTIPQNFVFVQIKCFSLSCIKRPCYVLSLFMSNCLNYRSHRHPAVAKHFFAPKSFLDWINNY